jgi:hypothetical protein
MALNSGSSALSLRDEAGEDGAALAGEEFLGAGEAELLHGGAGLAAEPGFVGGELGVERGPFGRGERGLAAPSTGVTAALVQRGEGGGPGGIDALVSGSARPASMRASGNPATSSAVAA